MTLPVLVQEVEATVASIIFDDYQATPAASTTYQTWTVPLLGTGIYRFHWYLYALPGGAVELTVNGAAVFTPETLNVQHEFVFQLALNAGDVVKVNSTANINTSYPLESDLVITQIG